MDEGKVVVVKFLHFSKAFDTISHGIALDKLSDYKMNGYMLHWVMKQLNRAQRVVVKGATSGWWSLMIFPQSSILGWVLFYIFINDPDAGVEHFLGNLLMILNLEVLLVTWRDKRDLDTLDHCQSSVAWNSANVNVRCCTWDRVRPGIDWDMSAWTVAQQKGIWVCWSTVSSTWASSVTWQPRWAMGKLGIFWGTLNIAEPASQKRWSSCYI